DYQIIKTLDEASEKAQQYIAEAYRLVYVHGENGEKGKEMILGYQLSTFAPVFEKADVSNATVIGDGAFAYNRELQEVTLGNNLEAIEGYTFAICTSLTDFALPSSVKSVGEYAFYLTGLSGALNLSNVESIGDYAYTDTMITSILLKDGASIGEGAFDECEFLATADLSKTTSIGNYAFQKTALTSVDLSAAKYVGDFAFGESQVTAVTFGKAIENFGENPFYGCEIETYGVMQDVLFNETFIKKEMVETYAINDTVQVIDGVLYQKVKNGLELVSYPMLKDLKAYEVEEGTVRITARAFYGATLENVTLPWSLLALGDKAFYECNNLSVVVFKSYDAPILEEEYDTSRLSYDCLPMTGKIANYEGLGIVKYYMWNPTAQFSNFYFGANFVDFIGDVNKNIVMVKPANGKNYNTFIMGQYFNMMIEGSNAITQEAVNVVSLINLIPDKVALSDEATIVTARAAYEKLTSLEQRALITDAYNKLSEAEMTLEYLKLNSGDTPTEPEGPTGPEGPTIDTPDVEESNGALGYIIAVAALSTVVVGLAVCIVLRERKYGNLFSFLKKKTVNVEEFVEEVEISNPEQVETPASAEEQTEE
ncbi:MAG: leucine-rich repeat protein, partial [Clostridia bacterium]|nr:leucine-rich repeat protein [Clostridia bacterium]